MEDKRIFIIYVIFFLCATLFSLLINSIFIRFAKTLGIRDKDQQIVRWSSVAKPAFGGISFFIVFLLSAASYSIFFHEDEGFPNPHTLGLIGSTALAFLMGLADDAYNTRPLLKFSVQLACGVILILTGTYIQIFDSQWANYALTMFFVVGMMNSINMLDNMDGITTVTSAGIIVSGLIYMILLGDYEGVDLMIAVGVLASLISFLFINWHPSKMFMGDTGSQFLGIYLSFIGINYMWNSQGLDGEAMGSRQLIIVALAFALPIIDTTTVSINRILRKQSPFVGGRDHTTHHLSYLGLSDSQVAFTFAGLSFLSIIFTFCIYTVIDDWSLSHFWLFGAYFIAIFITLFYITSRNKDKRR